MLTKKRSGTPTWLNLVGASLLRLTKDRKREKYLPLFHIAKGQASAQARGKNSDVNTRTRTVKKKRTNCPPHFICFAPARPFFTWIWVRQGGRTLFHIARGGARRTLAPRVGVICDTTQTKVRKKKRTNNCPLTSFVCMCTSLSSYEYKGIKAPAQAPGSKAPSWCLRKHRAPKHNNQNDAIALTQFLCQYRISWKPFQHTCLSHLQDCVVNGNYLALHWHETGSYPPHLTLVARELCLYHWWKFGLSFVALSLIEKDQSVVVG